MKTAFRKSFTRDLKRLKDQELLVRIRKGIESVETAKSLSDLRNLKKLTGAGNNWRIRIGDYRIGIVVEGETVDFVRCLSRRDLYRYFP